MCARQVANDALAREKERMDVLLARQHNLISCVLEGDISGGGNGKHGSAQHRTLGEVTHSSGGGWCVIVSSTSWQLQPSVVL
jgi:hypothetical protein